MNSDIEKFIKEFIPQFQKKNIVILTGAGISTTSGIKDFRGSNGLYKENINAELILSHDYFINNPKEFFEFFKENLLTINAKPNPAHILISELRKEGYVKSIITQNIDGLDIKAGSTDVIELHGSLNEYYCVNCHKKYSLNEIKNMDLIPKCEKCNSIIRPNIVLYGENLDNFKLMNAKEMIKYATTLLVIGSSLRVNPASSLVHDFIVDSRFNHNKKLFIINKGETDYDGFVKDNKYDGDVMDFVKVLKKYKRL